MPSIVIYGIPPVDRPDAVLALKHAVVAAADIVKVKEGRVPVYCPCDRDTLEVGQHITVSIEGLFQRASRSGEVRTKLCERILVVVHEWAMIHVPQCTYIEIQLDIPYLKWLGHAEWCRDAKPKDV